MQDQTWALMERHLEDDTYDIMSARESAPSTTRLEALAAELGCVFPEAFIAHASGRFGGLYVAAKESIWPRAKEFDVAPFWSFLFGVCTFNDADEIPEFMDLRKVTAQFHEETGSTLVPFMKVIGDPNRYCFDANGEIHLWDSSSGESEPVGRSFFELLDVELAALKERKDMKLEASATRSR